MNQVTESTTSKEEEIKTYVISNDCMCDEYGYTIIKDIDVCTECGYEVTKWSEYKEHKELTGHDDTEEKEIERKWDWEKGDTCIEICWEDGLENFSYTTSELREKNPLGFWRVSGIQLWNRQIGGIFEAKTVEDIISHMTVQNSWIMKYTVHDDHITYSLSHHDAPMGSASRLEPVPTCKECHQPFEFVETRYGGYACGCENED